MKRQCQIKLRQGQEGWRNQENAGFGGLGVEKGVGGKHQDVREHQSAEFQGGEIGVTP